jgi:hypothetical protein
MIDSVKLIYDLFSHERPDINFLEQNNKIKKEENKDWTTTSYKYYKNDIEYKYYINRNKRIERMMVKGKLIYAVGGLSKHDIIGDLQTGIVNKYGELVDLDLAVDNINVTIKEVFGIDLDVRKFNVKYIEFCCNVWTPHTGKYIELFNLIYKSKNNDCRHNWVIDKDTSRGLDTSFYVKARSQFEKQLKTKTTVNFYNKQEQLEHIREVKKIYKIKKEDIDEARNIFRLEIQCGYQGLKDIRKKFEKEYNLSKDFFFEEFLNNDALVREILILKYKFFISKRGEYLKFYSYEKAKKIISDIINPDFNKNRLLGYLYKKSTNPKTIKDTQRRTYSKILARFGIHDYLLPTKWGLDELESPIVLVDEVLWLDLLYKQLHTNHSLISELEAKTKNDLEKDKFKNNQNFKNIKLRTLEKTQNLKKEILENMKHTKRQ